MDEVDRMKNMARVEVIHPVKGHRFAIAVIQFLMYSTLHLYFIFVLYKYIYVYIHRFTIALNQFVTYSTLYLYLKSTYSTKQVTWRYTNATNMWMSSLGNISIIPPESCDASPVRFLQRMVGRDRKDCSLLQRVHHDCSQVSFSSKL